VDVAAQRAKQLRRGALPRIERQPGSSGKLDRVAMQEVRQGLIGYTLPVMPTRER
jgi:DNA-directed RNA polymerase subunit K/omega